MSGYRDPPHRFEVQSPWGLVAASSASTRYSRLCAHSGLFEESAARGNQSSHPSLTVPREESYQLPSSSWA